MPTKIWLKRVAALVNSVITKEFGRLKTILLCASLLAFLLLHIFRHIQNGGFAFHYKASSLVGQALGLGDVIISEARCFGSKGVCLSIVKLFVLSSRKL